MDDKLEQLKKLGLATPNPPMPPVPALMNQSQTPVVSYELSSTDDVKELAKEASPHAIRELFQIGMGGGEKPAPAAVRIAALKEVLDRGYGKAAQFVEVELSHTDIIRRIQKTQGEVIDADAVTADAEEIEGEDDNE